MQVKIINNSKHPLPKYEVEGSAGMDLRANIGTPIRLMPLERKLIPTGIHIQLHEGTEAQIRPRSGLAFKHGITVLNSPGTIDSGFTNEIGVLLVNLSKDDFLVQDGDRIAQMVVSKHEYVYWDKVEVIEETSRIGGFGSTGVK